MGRKRSVAGARNSTWQCGPQRCQQPTTSDEAAAQKPSAFCQMTRNMCDKRLQEIRANIAHRDFVEGGFWEGIHDEHERGGRLGVCDDGAVVVRHGLGAGDPAGRALRALHRAVLDLDGRVDAEVRAEHLQPTADEQVCIVEMSKSTQRKK